MKTTNALGLIWVVGLTAALATEPIKPLTLDKPLLARWTFDEVSGGGCRDASGNGCDATATATPSGFERVPGVF